MANSKGPPPAPMHPDVANRLLDLLSTDDDFRTLFARDARAAIEQVGGDAAGGECMQLAEGQALASKEQIAADRQKLMQAMNVPWSFDGATDVSAR
jgi:putative modified peptide